MKHLKVKINKLEFSWEEILKDINFTLNENDRVSIVWPNWAWKTTLLKLITWEIKWFDGWIENVWNMTIWYLQQIYSDDENRLVKDELKDGFRNIVEMESDLKNLEEKMSQNPENLQIIEDYTTLLDRFNNIWWYDYNNKIHAVATGMWIIGLLDKKLSEVSWWQRTKIALAKVLLESPDILFLDEPTNFIDMAWVEWLESYLKNKWTWGFIIVSHDREFLDKVSVKTFDLQPKRDITIYHGNYTYYVDERKRVEKKKMQDWLRQDEYIKKQENLINKFRAWSRAWWAKSREKMIDKMELLVKPFIPQKPKFFFEYLWECPEKVINIKESFIGRKEPLFFINEAILTKKQRIWIVWDNWVWKSTLLKTIIWELDILDWTLIKWKAVKIVYYSQMHEELDQDKTIRENFEKHWLNYPEQNLIWLLKHYLFEKEDIDRKVSSLSGGQTSKLLFAILGQKEANLLILDEPTNHLDYDTREALEFALKQYEWSILFISHDRYFVNKLATHIWFITDWELSLCYWNYEDYRFKLENNVDMDINIFDEENQLNIVLEEKIWERNFKKLQNKYSGKYKRKRK